MADRRARPGRAPIGAFLLWAWPFVVPSVAEAQSADWRADWVLADGLTMEVDTEGYRVPTSIAVVPDPGSDPDAPVYFVTELEGAVKVVSRNGRVRTFADDFVRRDRLVELPAVEAETGLAGICLAPDQGFVFVTYAYADEAGLLRNAIRRFETSPVRFSLRPTADTLIATFLAEDVTNVSHQIGNCAVRDGRLYVGVGDGHQPYSARSLSSGLGKIHRMTLDGDAPADNPYWSAENPSAPASYVWALGFRNPFALALADGELFVAANGTNIDRLVAVERGLDYRWDGSDESIATAADVSFYPAIAPVQIAHYEGGGTLPPELDGDLLMVTSGDLNERGFESSRLAKAMIGLSWHPSARRLDESPRLLVKYVGDGFQSLVGLAVGPTGILVAPLFPITGDRSVVFRVSRDSTNSWPNRIGPEAFASDAPTLIRRYGCESCHGFAASDTTTMGPTLHPRTMAERIRERLASEDYLAALSTLDSSSTPTAAALRPARRRLLDAPPDSAVWTYVYLQLDDPRFDDLTSGMPVLHMPERDARTLAEYLARVPAEPPAPDVSGGPVDWIYDLLEGVGLVPDPVRYRHLVVAFIAGAVLSLLLGGAIALRRRP